MTCQAEYRMPCLAASVREFRGASALVERPLGHAAQNGDGPPCCASPFRRGQFLLDCPAPPMPRPTLRSILRWGVGRTPEEGPCPMKSKTGRCARRPRRGIEVQPTRSLMRCAGPSGRTWLSGVRLDLGRCEAQFVALSMGAFFLQREPTKANQAAGEVSPIDLIRRASPHGRNWRGRAGVCVRRCRRRQSKACRDPRANLSRSEGSNP
jgi:hypothetical protein